MPKLYHTAAPFVKWRSQLYHFYEMETGRGAAAPLDSPPAAYIKSEKKGVVFPLPFLVDLWYNRYAVHSQTHLFYTEGGELPLGEFLISFMLSIAASVIAYYLCKVLDAIVQHICKWLGR